MPNAKESAKAKIIYDGQEVEYAVFTGTEQESALDIRSLRKDTGLITYDPGYVNTGSCESGITYIDGEQGILRYRGYNVEDLAEHCSFIEVAYLLIHGSLPNPEQRRHFSELLNKHSMIHEDMRHFFQHYPEHAHPMAVLSAMAVSLSSFYPELERSQDEELDITVARLLSKLRTIAAYSYKKFMGHPIVYPRQDLKYCENFLNMMFTTPVNPYKVDPVVARALNQLLVIHADHEQNCSTSVVRMVGSAEANLYASVSAGICALWGPLHGGANQHVIEMLESIQRSGKVDMKKVLERAKDKNDPFRLMGFGHRVYKSYDPRAKVAKKLCKEVLKHMGESDPLLEVAQELEAAALQDAYFQDRNLYPNVDFYTGLTYRAMGIPTNMFTVMFALGRMPGWIAQWLEMKAHPENRIGRPRQIYIGPNERRVMES